MQDRYKIIIEIIKNAVKQASNTMINESTGGTTKQERIKETENKKERRINLRNPVTWWDEECRIVIEDRKRKLKRYQETLSLTDFIEYKKARAIARKTVKFKKKEDFKRFAASLNKNTNLKYVWQKMKVVKKGFNTIDWNKWNKKNREEEILKEIDKIAPAWVKNEEEGMNIDYNQLNGKTFNNERYNQSHIQEDTYHI